MVTFASQETRGSLAGSSILSSGSVFESSDAAMDAPHMHDGTSTRSHGDSSQNANAVIQSTQTSPNGISIFQEYTYYLLLISYMIEMQILT